MNFLNNYFNEYVQLFNGTDIAKLFKFAQICLETKKSGGKIIFAGNGASASISSQAATDFTQHANIRTVAMNDHNQISAFGNDYGYENWVSNSLEFYADSNDLVVLISSSGKSMNIINAALKAKELGNRIITFTGFNENNELRKLGDLNFWVNSTSYNHVENIHLSWILLTATFIEKGKQDRFYSDSIYEIIKNISDSKIYEDLEKYKTMCIECSKNRGKVIYLGNGGSASLSSHAAIDFTKQSKIRSVAFNDHNLLTCFANDYGLDNWMLEALKAYSDSADLLVLASCSGKSKNVLIAAEYWNSLNLPMITFSGFNNMNPLSNLGNVNFYAESSEYSIVQSIHSIWVFAVADWIFEIARQNFIHEN